MLWLVGEWKAGTTNSRRAALEDGHDSEQIKRMEDDRTRTHETRRLLRVTRTLLSCPRGFLRPLRLLSSESGAQVEAWVGGWAYSGLLGFLDPD